MTPRPVPQPRPYATTQATALAEQLRLEIDGRAVPLTLTSSTIEFPVGQAGLLTQRLTLHLRAADDALTAAATWSSPTTTSPAGWGWQEVIAASWSGDAACHVGCGRRGREHELRLSGGSRAGTAGMTHRRRSRLRRRARRSATRRPPSGR
ncbi:MAG: hypothetical protein R3A10_18220 [Caldilineaceae bacterium]